MSEPCIFRPWQPGMVWGPHLHRHPCPETDRIDILLNELNRDTVVLSPAQSKHVEQAGWDKWRRKGSEPHKYGCPLHEDSPQRQINAFGAELSQAIRIGVKWRYVYGNDLAGDIGPGLQVRHTFHRDGKLIVHEWTPQYEKDRGDDPMNIFFLVTGRLPRFICRGWLWGYEAQQKKFWYPLTDNRPSFNAPQSELRPVKTFVPYTFRLTIPDNWR